MLAPWTLRFGLVIPGLVLFVAVPPAAGQTVDFPGGALVLTREAVAMHAASPDYEALVAVDVREGRTNIGGTLRRRSPTLAVTLGDEQVPIAFFTDVFETGQAFAARGAAVVVTRGATRASGFAGTSAALAGAPAGPGWTDHPVAALSLKQRLKPRLALATDVLMADKRTLVSGLEWTARDRVRAAVVGGVGASRPFVAASLVAERSWITLQASYLQRSAGFHRPGKRESVVAAADGERVLVSVKPVKTLTVSAGRELQRSPGPEARPARLVNHYTIAKIHGPCRVSAGMLHFSRDRSDVSGRSGAAGGVCGRKSQVAITVVQGARSASALNPQWLRDSMAQLPEMPTMMSPVVQPSSMSIGGQFLTRAGTIRLDYRTLLLPYADGSPRDRAIGVNVRIALFSAPGAGLHDR